MMLEDGCELWELDVYPFSPKESLSCDFWWLHDSNHWIRPLKCRLLNWEPYFSAEEQKTPGTLGTQDPGIFFILFLQNSHDK